MHRAHIYNGIYYPKDIESINSTINSFYNKLYLSKDYENLDFILKSIKNRKILCAIVPHGSYHYSGYVASFVYYLIKKINCNNFIVISSDHKGTSPGISIINEGYWTTPLGKIQINEKMANDLRQTAPDIITFDPYSFKIDHTIELQLPFLQSAKGNNIKFLPILQKKQDVVTSTKLAEQIYSILPSNESVTFLVTSNFSHYLTYEESYMTDLDIITKIRSMDIDLYHKTISKSSNICGYGCIATFIALTRFFHHTKIELLKYQNSGDIDENKSSVVGYGSILAI